MNEKELQKELKRKLEEWRKKNKYNKKSRYCEEIFNSVNRKPHIIKITYCDECYQDECFDEKKCIGCKLKNKVKSSYVSGDSLFDSLPKVKWKYTGFKVKE